MWSLNFWTYVVEVGMVIKSGLSLRVMLMGSQGYLLYIGKYGLKPEAELQVQLYTWTSTPILPFQSDLHSGGSIPNMLFRVELNLSYWPFVWGWYGLGLCFLVPINSQRLAMSLLSKFLPEADLPKPHIQYSPHQNKHLQMKDPSLAIIINKLQKSTQPHKPLPNTYFLNTDDVLYHCVREGSQGFEAVVLPKKLYQLVLTMCHDLMGHNGTTQLYWYIRRFYFWEKLKQDCTKHVVSMQRMSTGFFERMYQTCCVNSESVNKFLWKNHVT